MDDATLLTPDTQLRLTFVKDENKDNPEKENKNYISECNSGTKEKDTPPETALPKTSAVVPPDVSKATPAEKPTNDIHVTGSSESKP